MTKQELFKKFNIDESHKEWDSRIDNWMHIEIFRVMHDGRLPNRKDTTVKYILHFAEKLQTRNGLIELSKRADFGSIFLTHKRLLYRFADGILEELQKK